MGAVCDFQGIGIFCVAMNVNFFNPASMLALRAPILKHIQLMCKKGRPTEIDSRKMVGEGQIHTQPCP